MRGRCRLTYKIVGKNEGGRKGGKQEGELVCISKIMCVVGVEEMKRRGKITP